MDHLKYWSKDTNPETGAKFEAFLDYLRVGHNGDMDVDGCIRSEYGKEFTKRLQIRFTYEDDAMGEAALAYYRSLGLKKEMFEADDYFTRWALFTPLEMYTEKGKGKKYPLIFSHHGGGSSIETEEFSTGYPQIAAREGFMVAYLQNTNWENVDRVLNIIIDKYPVDTERVYVSGFSQGGSQTHSVSFRIPERLAAAAPNGNDIYKSWDGFNLLYKRAEVDHLRETFLPFMQIVSVCDASSYVPLNNWKPRKAWPSLGDPETYHPAGADRENDPTWIHDAKYGFRDAFRLKMFKETGKEPGWFMGRPSTPPEGCNVPLWAITRLNKRFDLLGIEPVDVDKCISYADTPEDELHHVLGFYGDEEKIETYYGTKHYTVNCQNKDGINAFRFVAVDNWPHWPSLMHAELDWAFFKQFRRDTETGKIVEEEYKYEA